ncbi:heavy metal-associated isoprenylated plant protein 7-like [Zingiber officinale]|uniref:heavy metal-associated isoprenylated plant protein 7-like n=1 Tax=Zingiber officinale TaxID=94328 RepID=UPI001C4DCE62|nr:heavy metal-associated isoprenylated plant protein 7-like [Zingiber officinale]
MFIAPGNLLSAHTRLVISSTENQSKNSVDCKTKSIDQIYLASLRNGDRNKIRSSQETSLEALVDAKFAERETSPQECGDGQNSSRHRETSFNALWSSEYERRQLKIVVGEETKLSDLERGMGTAASWRRRSSYSGEIANAESVFCTEEEKPEGERRTLVAAAEDENAKGSDKEEEEEEEEGEKNVESPSLPSEEEESEGNGGEGDTEGYGENIVEAPVEVKPKGGNGKKEKKQRGKQEKKEPPSPPEEIELRVSMHCDGCSRKIRCILKSYEGVTEVAADGRAQKVVVKGKKPAASPLKVVEHLERETDKKVQLPTPLPPPQPGKKKPKAKDQLKKKKKKEGEDKKEEIVVASFKLKMHCPACAQKIAKKILKMQGVESAEADWEASKVTVKGVFTAEKLAGYVYEKTTKYVVVTRDEPAAAPEKVEEETSGGGGEEEEDESGGAADLSGAQEQEEDDIDEGEDAEDEMIDKGSGKGKEAIGMQPTTRVAEEEEAAWKQRCQPCSAYDTRFPPNVCPLCGRGSFYYPVQNQEYPAAVFPHLFSDENPNACSLM